MEEGEEPGAGGAGVESGRQDPSSRAGRGSILIGQGPGWLLIAPKREFLFSFPPPL